MYKNTTQADRKKTERMSWNKQHATLFTRNDDLKLINMEQA